MRRRSDRAAVGNSDSKTDYGAPTRSQEKTSWAESGVFLGCVAFRLVNALLVQTYFNPDEHWQSTEVAHRIVFGYGHMTWEWSRGLRGYLHPLIFAGLYKVLAMLNLDSRWVVMKSPRLLQAIFAAVGDYYSFKLGKHLWGECAARWVLFCQLVNWFTFFCMVRPFSNSLETVLTSAAIYYWCIGKESYGNVPFCSFKPHQVALLLSALACAVRPTSAVVWLYVGFIHLFQVVSKLQLLTEAVLLGGFMLGATCLIDRWMYTKWTFVPLNFVTFNFLSAGGDYYGTHPWHWYFSQGFPAMIFSFLPLSVLGVWWSKQWQIAGLIGWVISLYSFLGHKEFRFVLPVLPLAILFAGYGLAVIEQSSASLKSCSASGTLQGYDSDSSLAVARKKAGALVQRKQFWYLATTVGLLATNVPTALYMSLVHQRGSEAVMQHISNQAAKELAKEVMFLMPCHSTPFYSFIHVNISMRFLDCSPSNEVGYVDEADRFLAEPDVFLSQMFKYPLQLPTHFVLFDSLEEKVLPFLKRHGYEEEARIFHAHFAVDRGLQNYVLVYSSVGFSAGGF